MEKILSLLLGDYRNLGVERKFIMLAPLVAALAAFFGIFINLPLGDNLLIFLTFGALAVYLLAFFIMRFTGRKDFALLLMVFYTLLYVDYAWFACAGSQGSTIIVFVTIMVFVFFVFKKWSKILVSAVVFINLAGLLWLEKSNPQWVIPYTSDTNRIYDVYGTFLMCNVVIFFILYSARQFYQIEKRKAEESERLKSAFLTNMSHEIRTPMNSILGFAELLGNEESKEEKERFLTLMRSNGEMLLNLINDIIDFSKIESGLLSIKKEKFLLRNLLGDIEAHYQNSGKYAYEKAIDFKLINYGNDNEILFQDRLRLKQIFTNLLDNAFKFTTKGHVHFGVKQNLNDKIEFYVEDTGIGILQEDFKKIFQRFQQVDDQARTNAGTGLGLAICSKLTELMGGSIRLESEPGKGSTFLFSISKLL